MGKRRALLSVSDKTGLETFAKGLVALGFELLSTGGTAAALRKAGLSVTDVSAVTGFPEIMDGRVKTLHPRIHGGLLARTGIDDTVAAEHGIQHIDLLAVNLYPFQTVAAQPDCSYADAVENIDIGGPAMLRAAAKNHERVTVVVDSGDYSQVLEMLKSGAQLEGMRRNLARKAFAHTAQYDAAISAWLEQHCAADEYPESLVLSAARKQQLRYGENPHQQAALYVSQHCGGDVASAAQLQGKELSYNNIADADAATQCVKAFDDCACVIVKHANPCGVAVAEKPELAYRRAWECDSTSAFGGIIAFNRAVDGDTARRITEQQFAEVIIAPEFEQAAVSVLADKPNIRVLCVGPMSKVPAAREIKSIEGGWLVQDRDCGDWGDLDIRCVTQQEPNELQLHDLRFAWTVAKFVKSNAIVYASQTRTLGIGAGQMSRVDSARIAALKAGEAGFDLNGAVMASDAFFPFRDAIDAAAERGIRAIIHPGGGIREAEVIAAADEHGMAMLLTGMRHFRH